MTLWIKQIIWYLGDVQTDAYLQVTTDVCSGIVSNRYDARTGNKAINVILWNLYKFSRNGEQSPDSCHHLLRTNLSVEITRNNINVCSPASCCFSSSDRTDRQNRFVIVRYTKAPWYWRTPQQQHSAMPHVCVAGCPHGQPTYDEKLELWWFVNTATATTITTMLTLAVSATGSNAVIICSTAPELRDVIRTFRPYRILGKWRVQDK